MNGGRTPWGNTEHLIADLWALTLQANSNDKSQVRDHPVREADEAEARAEERRAKVAELRAVFENQKRTYRLEDGSA